MNKNINCPNCGEPWSVLEVQEQECFECGYPNHDPDADAVDYIPGLVHEIPHSGRGLTTFLQSTDHRQQTTVREKQALTTNY